MWSWKDGGACHDISSIVFVSNSHQMSEPENGQDADTEMISKVHLLLFTHSLLPPASRCCCLPNYTTMKNLSQQKTSTVRSSNEHRAAGQTSTVCTDVCNVCRHMQMFVACSANPGGRGFVCLCIFPPLWLPAPSV